MESRELGTDDKNNITVSELFEQRDAMAAAIIRFWPYIESMNHVHMSDGSILYASEIWTAYNDARKYIDDRDRHMMIKYDILIKAFDKYGVHHLSCRCQDGVSACSCGFASCYDKVKELRKLDLYDLPKS